ncbi:hypothetical protein CDIK_3569 [Cucumispora dikerogammari]|nr:hypothetical protein CDIK_3569 [Cucumispora dikerogammari]
MLIYFDLTKKLTDDMRRRNIEAHNSDKSAKVIAGIPGIKRTTVSMIIRSFVNTRNIQYKKRTKVKKKVKLRTLRTIKTCIDDNCAISLRDIKTKCRTGLNIEVSISTIAKTIKVFNYSLKRFHLVPERRNVLGLSNNDFFMFRIS